MPHTSVERAHASPFSTPWTGPGSAQMPIIWLVVHWYVGIGGPPLRPGTLVSTTCGVGDIASNDSRMCVYQTGSLMPGTASAL